MMEDALVIYQYMALKEEYSNVDVGNLPKLKAEQYLKDVMTQL